MRTSALIREEIEKRFGFFPPFFEPAVETPEILENLWQQTLFAYVNNPIPPLFREKLFAYLSRFCSVPYCIVCHSCALRPMMMTAEDVLKMLEEPAPYDEIEISDQISLLNATKPLNAWPEKDSEIEESLFACSVFMFLDPSRSKQCRAELRRILGTLYYNHLIEFLLYVKTCHLWVEAHPEMSYEADKRAIENLGPLLKEKPLLAEFFKTYNEKIVMEVRKREEKLKASLSKIKKIDKILKESEEQLRGTFEQAAVGIAHVAPDGRWLRVNQKLCDIVGYSKEELLKLTFQDITHPDDLDTDLGYVLQVLADEIKTYSMEKRYYRKDGSIVWINLTVSLLRETSGEPKYFISVVEDISDRKNAEEALKKSEAGLAEAQRIARLGNWEWDILQNKAYCSDEVDRIFGYMPGEFGRNYEALMKTVHPDDRELVEKKFKEALNEGKPFDFERRVVRPDGTVRIVHERSERVRYEMGKPVRMLGIVQDITESRHAEMERDLLQDLSLAISEAEDLKSALNTAIKKICEVTEWRFGEAWVPNHEKTAFEFVNVWDKWGEDINKFIEFSKGVIFRSGEGLPGRIWATKKPEWVRDLSVNGEGYLRADSALKADLRSGFGIPIIAGDEVIAVIVFYMQESREEDAHLVDLVSSVAVQIGSVIQRKLAEGLLKKSEARLRAFVNALPDIAFILDEKGRYVEVLTAPRAEPLLYSAINDLKGRLMHDVLPREDADKFLSVIHKTIDTEAPQIIEYDLSVQAGRMWFEGRTAPLPIEGENRMVVWVSRDITERRKADEEREKIQRLESIGILAGGIAHDFNNLLAGILGNIDLAKMLVKPGDKLYKRLEDTETASLRARDLTQQLLTFSKGGEPVKKDFSVPALLRDSIGFTLSGSNVRCEFLIPDDLWPVNADEGQINQVINNIVINAVQAMPGGGVISVSCNNVLIGAKDTIPIEKGQYVKITLQDRGTGISEEHLARIFDPYFTTKEGGKGLGLATCYSIIKRHGGHITVDSQLGVGTAFHIYLPASPDAVLVEKAEEEKPFIGSGRILVMDDEEIVRMVAKEMLLTLGHEAAVARDGAEAIELYRNAKSSGQPFDAVIMDLTIPGGMGGKEAIGRLKEIDPEVKGIVSSGYSNDPVIANHQKYGFVGFVIKPYTVKDLSEALHKALQVK